GEVGRGLREPRDQGDRPAGRAQQGSNRRQPDERRHETREDCTPVARLDRGEITPPRGGAKLGRRLRRRKVAEEQRELVVVESLAHAGGAPSSALLSCARPRWSHVMIVPIGTSRAAAMSRYDICSMWKRTMASRGPSSRSARA